MGRPGDSAGDGERRNESRHERKTAKHRLGFRRRTSLFSVGNRQCVGLDTDLLGMGKVHNRETASAGTGIAGRFSPTPLCLTWSVM